ncbi:CPBP family intramembrane glutamic endopeptidase [uncultured Proteiniphilum sp.]|uniref:CPBP family intramembrane glutamic endopeptidase n=1 Tax=uncultured Proteiniphilum sp. TaxID=497637 RepID=UPI0026371B68|nr:CPBP family intramembrane glutamic endopeptidase [uncultured Proteiniphilum sp.]
MKNELRPLWSKHFKFDWKFGLFLLVIVCIPRFLLVLKANQTGNYAPIGAIMFISALVPFLFLNKYGRNQIGIKASKEWGALILAFTIGIVFSLLLYFIGKELYGNSLKNWYEYIGNSYNIPEVISLKDKRIMFMITATTGMIFSPIGEELFFRGIVHSSFTKSISEKKASIIDSLAFSITHISHFGLVYLNSKWNFYLIPALIWVGGMFIVSIIFFKMKKFSGSLLGAVFCHAGFNLGMIYSIFYLL